MFGGFVFSAVATNWWTRYENAGWHKFDDVPVIGWILGMRRSPRCLQMWDLFGFSIFLRELLDAAATDVVSLGDVSRVKVVIDNKPTYSGDIILLQLHLTRPIQRSIVATKSFPDSTL